MKKILISLFLLTGVVNYAQQTQDLVLFGLEQRTGTPRFQAMAGAFGSLGADFSAMAINPAGTAVFSYNQLGFTISQYSSESEAVFNGQSSSANKGILSFNQAGVVFVYKSKNNSPWKKISLGLNSDNSNQYRGQINANGETNSGLDAYFLDYANGIPFGDLLKLDNELLEEAYLNIGADIGFAAQQGFLGYYGGVIDPSVVENNAVSSYISNAIYSQARQSQQIESSGKNSKFIATAAAQFKDFLYLGAGLEFHNIQYEKQSNIQEDGYSQDSDLSFLNFDNFINTTGEGVALSVGAISRIGEYLRLGLSYKTPTWYTLTDKTHQQLRSNLEDIDLVYIDENQINIFEEYRMTTPSKITASSALVFGSRGLISLDYSRQDFSKARFRPLSDSYFSSLNQQANTTLDIVNTLQIGGEYNLGRLSFRAGYSYANSPYKTNDFITKNVAAGLGWIFKGSKVEFALSSWETQNSSPLLIYPGATNTSVNTKRNIGSLGYTLFF